MALTPSDFVRLTTRILDMKQSAEDMLTRTTDALQRKALERVQAPLRDALCALDVEHNAELDAEAAERAKADRQRQDAIAWGKSLREFPPEIAGAFLRSTDAACPDCGTVTLLGQTSGLCETCWHKAGCP